jgi:hypothetical protein
MATRIVELNHADLMALSMVLYSEEGSLGIRKLYIKPSKGQNNRSIVHSNRCCKCQAEICPLTLFKIINAYVHILSFAI